jgi:hypothetical protein
MNPEIALNKDEDGRVMVICRSIMQNRAAPKISDQQK